METQWDNKRCIRCGKEWSVTKDDPHNKDYYVCLYCREKGPL